MGKTRRSKPDAKLKLPHGLNSKTFPLSVREFVEIDYISKLGPEEREWLARFNDRYHGADFRRDDGETPDEQRREAYNRKNKANNDVYAVSRATGLAVSTVRDHDGGDRDILGVIAADVLDTTEPPPYLASPEYRKALARVRALLPKNPRNKVRNTPELRSAYAALERAKKGHP